MSAWEWVGVGILASLVVSVLVGLFLGRVIRLRDAQVPQHREWGP